MTLFLLNVSQDGQMSCFPSVFHLIGYFSVHWPVEGLNNVFIKRANKFYLLWPLFDKHLAVGKALIVESFHYNSNKDVETTKSF